MDVMDFLKMAGSAGFAVTCCYAMAKWTAGRTDKADIRAEKLESDALKREERMATRLDTVENEFKAVLVDTIKSNTEVLTGTKEILCDCRDVMRDCTEVMRDCTERLASPFRKPRSRQESTQEPAI